MPFEPSNALSHDAQPREIGAACPHCQRFVEAGDRVTACSACGAVHHASCWQAHDGCGAYECAPPRRVLQRGGGADIRITASELDAARPLPKPPRPSAANPFPVSVPPPQAARVGVQPLAVVSFAVAAAGVLLLGIVTGIVAIALGALALGRIQQGRQRGTAWAIGGVLLGLADVVGWILLLALMFPGMRRGLEIDDFELDPAVLENVAPAIGRALRANVWLETQGSMLPFASRAMGSGVIVALAGGQALIVTNRHVVDPGFEDGDPSSGSKDAEISVRAVGQLPVSGRLAWVAPGGIDLAVLAAPIHSPEARAVAWLEGVLPAMGEEVFSIGNPQGLGWTHTKGTVSQVRARSYGDRRIAMIQTDTAVNPGNSGGGLYNQQGLLVGINTWTNDKRVSEGLSFAISLKSLVELNPPFVGETSRPEQTSP